MGADIRTKHGYSFWEVTSAFQKAIRRCDEDQAMFWAVELYESNKANYVWKRMLIMSSEDVGMGDPDVNTRIYNLFCSYTYLVNLHDKGLPEKLPFTQAVLTLVHAKKSRYVDLAITVYWNKVEKEFYEIPDYAYDMHTWKGKQMGRGREYFYREASLVNNPNYMSNEQEMKALAYKYGGGDKPQEANVEDIDINAAPAGVPPRAKPKEQDLFK